jgi:hypothetical protein
VLIAERVVDVLTIAAAIALGLSLRKKWQARTSMVIAICLTVIWCAYSKHPAWLGGVPPVLVDLATFGLAYLGGHVALNPPAKDDQVLKRLYVFGFAFLFVIGMAANGWERTMEANKRDKLQQDQTTAETRFSIDLRDVKNSSDAILNYVAHPPKGATLEQLQQYAQSQLSNPRSNAAIVQSLPRYLIIAKLRDQAALMHAAWDEYWNKQDNRLSVIQNQGTRERALEIGRQRKQLEMQFEESFGGIVRDTEPYRSQALVYLAQVGQVTQQDKDEDAVFKNIRAGGKGYTDNTQKPARLASYIDSLANRLSNVPGAK